MCQKCFFFSFFFKEEPLQNENEEPSVKKIKYDIKFFISNLKVFENCSVK